MNEKKVTGFDYLWCALYACAAFAIELLLVFVEGKMGLDNNNLTVSQNIVHWVVTTILWVLAGVVVIFIGKKTTDFDVWEHTEKLKGWQYIALLVCFAVWNLFLLLVQPVQLFYYSSHTKLYLWKLLQ